MLNIIEKLQDYVIHIESAFLLILLMFYTRKIKTIAQAMVIWFIAVLFSSLTVPALVQLYIPSMADNVEVVSLLVVLFDVILVPLIIRIFAKELFTQILENKIIQKLQKTMGDKDAK